MLEGSFSAKTAMDLPLTTSLPSLVEMSPLKTPWVESSEIVKARKERSRKSQFCSSLHGRKLAIDSRYGDFSRKDASRGVLLLLQAKKARDRRKLTLEHVDHVLEVNEGVVDGNDVGVVVDNRVTENDTSDTTEAGSKQLERRSRRLSQLLGSKSASYSRELVKLGSSGSRRLLKPLHASTNQSDSNDDHQQRKQSLSKAVCQRYG